MTNKLLIATLIWLLALFREAVAAQSGMYISGAFGNSDSNVALGGINRVNGDDSSYAFGVGYTVNRNLSFEAAYQDYGSHSGQTNCPPGFACLVIPLPAEAELSGISFSVIGSVPLSERLNLYGRLGLLSWDIDFKGISSAFNDSGEDLLFGAGLDLSLNDRWSVFLEYGSRTRMPVADISLLNTRPMDGSLADLRTY